ncbi:hypothetical protein ACIBG0_40085 [Nocardia sp. NPDC050630]|uniref:hypothetical protein n=1 Tax=Nocardia sp. NPDC050630 TaxID=3364321 RepID=UPI0037A0C194
MTEQTTGDRLRAALSTPDEPYARSVLVNEAARVADRLDRLNELIEGDETTWAQLTTARDGDIEVRIDGALVEARQQANTLRQLLAEIRRQGPDSGDNGYDPLDDL